MNKYLSCAESSIITTCQKVKKGAQPHTTTPTKHTNLVRVVFLHRPNQVPQAPSTAEPGGTSACAAASRQPCALRVPRKDRTCRHGLGWSEQAFSTTHAEKFCSELEPGKVNILLIDMENEGSKGFHRAAKQVTVGQDV